MSDQDNPFDRSGRGTGARTVLAPHPGGRRPQGPPPLGRPEPPLPEARLPSPPSAPLGDTNADDEWIKTQEEAPRVETPPSQPRALRIEELVVPHQNPIMQAAGPILLLLGRLRVALVQASFASLMDQVAAAIEFFEKQVRAASVPAEQANTAKYILCATADDIVQNIPTEDRHVWTQHSMLSRFFRERIGGVRFFDELDRAKMDPLNNYPVLELIHSCLALGFQGVHRTSPNGTASLQLIQRNLYEILRKVRPRADRDLSPRWRGQKLARRALRARVPFWAIASLACVGLFALFLTLRTLLSGGAEAAAEQLAGLEGRGQLTLARRVIAPPPPPPPPAKCAQTDLPSGIECTVTPKAIKYNIAGEILFASGQATLKSQFLPIAKQLAQALEKEPGTITVIGHTDNIKLRKTSPFASNWELSMERAKAVAAVLKSGLSDPKRVETDGKADEVPIASNDTPEGRARNRRVEIWQARVER